MLETLSLEMKMMRMQQRDLMKDRTETEEMQRGMGREMWGMDGSLLDSTCTPVITPHIVIIIIIISLTVCE